MMGNLGYYNRPIASAAFVLIIAVTNLFFILNLWYFIKGKIGKKYLIYSSLLNVIILIFAYPYLSSDVFNYIFDAKIIFYYHLSPYTHRALDFPQDDWIRFMRWTHRYSPYGPLWLIYSLIPYALGLGKFVLTLLTFKLFISVFHLINAYFIYQILKTQKSNIRLFATASYALNPLVLSEAVANAHNDVVLATFLILPIYFLQKGDSVKSIASTLLGTLIKYIPVMSIPWEIICILRKDIFNLKKVIILNLVTFAVFTYLFSSFKITVPFVSPGSTQVQFQPWYLLWTLPFVPLISEAWLVAISVAISIGASLRYLPYIFNGDWSHPGTTQYMTFITILPAVLVVFAILTKQIIKKRW